MSTPSQDNDPQDPQGTKSGQPPSTPSGKSKNSRIDKLIMGAIIGVAVGSVVGMSMKDKEQQKPPIKPKSRIGKALGNLFSRKKKEKPLLQKDPKKIPSEME